MVGNHTATAGTSPPTLRRHRRLSRFHRRPNHYWTSRRHRRPSRRHRRPKHYRSSPRPRRPKHYRPSPRPRRPPPPTSRQPPHHYRRLHSQHHHFLRAWQSAIHRQARIRLPRPGRLVPHPARFRSSRSPPTRTPLECPRPGQGRLPPLRRPIRPHPWFHPRIRRLRCTWNRRRRPPTRHGRPLSYLMSSPRPTGLPLRTPPARHRPLPTFQGRRNPLRPSLGPAGRFARHALRPRNSLG